jgi:hypothetical protein
LLPALLTLPTVFLREINIIGSCGGIRVAPPAQLGYASQAPHEASDSVVAYSGPCAYFLSIFAFCFTF